VNPAVGVIGLGVMGEPIAALLIKAGYPVAVHDVRNEPMRALRTLGATPCASAAEVAHRSEMIIGLVADEAQTNDIVFGTSGILPTLKPGSVLALGSTIGSAAARRIGEALAARHVDTLDMPLSGGFLAARDGTLSVMAGGKRDVLQRALPVLRVFARDITHTGDVGSGQAAKLAHQLVFSLHVIALLEGLTLGAAAGIEPAVLKAVFKQGLAGSEVLERWDDLGPRWKGMLKATAPGATPPNMRKDLHLVLELARDLGVSLHLGSRASQIADAGTANGHDDPRF
jgi:2-hydroxy-3-oxopropionate reductase